MQILVGNLAFTATEEEVRQVFEGYGTVETVRLMTDRDTGRPRGFGFVEMPDTTQARAALVGLNGSTLGGRMLTINEARPLEGRGASAWSPVVRGRQLPSRRRRGPGQTRSDSVGRRRTSSGTWWRRCGTRCAPSKAPSGARGRASTRSPARQHASVQVSKRWVRSRNVRTPLSGSTCSWTPPRRFSRPSEHSNPASLTCPGGGGHA